VNALAEHPRKPPLQVRLRTRLRRQALDAALADGADPRGSRELAWRAHELALPRTRRQLARVLANVLDATQEPPSWCRARGVRPPLCSEEVLAAAPELRLLAARLADDPAPAQPQGLALASQLVWDSASPLFAPAPSGTVLRWAQVTIGLLGRAGDGPRYSRVWRTAVARQTPSSSSGRRANRVTVG
jgi:hypothetical protein